ncbi:right-handed parallel beta-helix repeat-containing protein [Spirosoma sordidisoli]|uniref:Right-handed parallel beta-helix repeat-containing protein n=1 Tax=Spirosoma sordidisoli TaxID=2502893 RepID=A0A4Q2ULX6_9BACT|nr:right-handed parallel beta-helix repeat-containing protein [Spirosoma sordidisoli]RYC69742.1 right-handed parallel beta-helix repeat-containing protein [Spirosoma sordidisoli]
MRNFITTVFLLLICALTGFAQVSTFNISEFRGNPISRKIVLTPGDTSKVITVRARYSPESREFEQIFQPTVTRQGLDLIFGWTNTDNLPSGWVQISIGGVIRHAGTLSINKFTSTPVPGSLTLVSGTYSFSKLIDVPLYLQPTTINQEKVATANALNQRVVHIADIATLTATSGSTAPAVIVRDAVRGGSFIFAASGYTVDQGTVFPALGGGYWVRQYLGDARVKWFPGATDTDCIVNALAGNDNNLLMEPRAYTATQFSIPSGKRLRGIADKTILRPSPSIVGQANPDYGYPGQVTGWITMSANNIALEDVTLDLSTNTTRLAAIKSMGVALDGWRVNNVTFLNGINHFIYVHLAATSKNIEITNNRFLHGDNGVSIRATVAARLNNNIKINGNTFDDVGGNVIGLEDNFSVGPGRYDTHTNVQVNNNIMTHLRVTGGYDGAIPLELHGVTNGVVSGNIVDSGTRGLGVMTSKNVVLEGNTVSNQTAYFSEIAKLEDCSFIGNVSKNNRTFITLSPSDNYAVPNKNILISGNQVIGNGIQTVAAGVDIAAINTSYNAILQNWVIENNVFTNQDFASNGVISIRGSRARPNLIFSGGGGSGAQATATLKVVSVKIDQGGSGYTSAPTVSVSAVDGSGATAEAVVTNGVVTSVIVTSAGDGYLYEPSIIFSGGGGSGASATPILGIASVSVVSGGSNYTSAPTILAKDNGVIVDEYGGLQTGGAVLTATISGGSVVSVNVVSPGNSFGRPNTNIVVRGNKFFSTSVNSPIQLINLTGRHLRVEDNYFYRTAAYSNTTHWQSGGVVVSTVGLGLLDEVAIENNTFLFRGRMGSGQYAAIGQYLSFSDRVLTKGLRIKNNFIDGPFTRGIYVNDQSTDSEILNNELADAVTTPYTVGTGKRVYSLRTFNGSSAPIAGNWRAGDKLLNPAPTLGQPEGFLCIASGSPGAWIELSPVGTDRIGDGSPNGVVAAPLGSIYRNTATGTAALYYKASGLAGNTGWRELANVSNTIMLGDPSITHNAGTGLKMASNTTASSDGHYLNSVDASEFFLTNSNSSQTRFELKLGTSRSNDATVGLRYITGTLGAGAGVLSIGQASKSLSGWTHGFTRFYNMGVITATTTPDNRLLIGTQTNNAADLLQVAGSVLLRRAEGAGPPPLSRLPASGDSILWRDTAAGTTKWYTNDGGTVVPVN